MLDQIKTEKDLLIRAKLLKKYIKRETRVLELARFLKSEIEANQSKVWVKFCKEIQSCLKKQFDSEKNVDNLAHFFSENFQGLENSKKLIFLEEIEQKNSSGIKIFLESNPEFLLIQSDPRVFRKMLILMGRADCLRQEEFYTSIDEVQSFSSTEAAKVKLKRFSSVFGLASVFVVSLIGVLGGKTLNTTDIFKIFKGGNLHDSSVQKPEYIAPPILETAKQLSSKSPIIQEPPKKLQLNEPIETASSVLSNEASISLDEQSTDDRTEIAKTSQKRSVIINRIQPSQKKLSSTHEQLSVDSAEKVLASKAEVKMILVAGIEKEGRADTILIFSLKDKQARLMSIPRDTKVRIVKDQVEQNAKLNHTHRWGGVPLLKEAISSLFPELNLSSHVVVDLSLFRKFVDMVGGVKLDVEMDMFYEDKGANFKIDLKRGEQILNGENAEAYVRFRADGKGDLGRVVRQQKFLSALQQRIHELNSFNLKNVKTLSRIPSFFISVFKEVETDLSPLEMANLVLQARSLSRDQMSLRTLTGKGHYEQKEGNSGLVNYYISDSVERIEAMQWIQFHEGNKSQNSSTGSSSDSLQKVSLAKQNKSP